MASATLLASGITSIVTGLAFGAVAWKVAHTTVSPDFTRARMTNAVWWGALGAYLLLQGTLTALASSSMVDGSAYLVSRLVAIPLLCAAAWGISAYLLFLFTGGHRANALLVGIYAGVGLLFFYVTFGQQPEFQVERWLVGFDDASALYRLVYILVGLPPIFAGIAYLTLLRRAEDRLQRRRILLVGASILLYVAGGLMARLVANDAVIFITLVPSGLLAAGCALLAHFPRPSTQPSKGREPARRVTNPAVARRLRELL